MNKYLEDPVLNLTAGTLRVLRWAMLAFLGVAVLGGAASLFAMLITDGQVLDSVQKRQLVTMGIPVIPMLFLTAQFFKLLRDLVLSVGDGQPLSVANAKRLRSMGLVVLILQAFIVVMTIGAGAVWGGELFNVDAAFDMFESILIAAVLFILARVFEHGARVQEELEGTV